MTSIRRTGKYFMCFRVVYYFYYAYFAMGKLLVRLRNIV